VMHHMGKRTCCIIIEVLSEEITEKLMKLQ